MSRRSLFGAFFTALAAMAARAFGRERAPFRPGDRIAFVSDAGVWRIRSIDGRIVRLEYGGTGTGRITFQDMRAIATHGDGT